MTKKCRKHVVMSIVLGIVFTLSLMFDGNSSTTNNIEAMAATGAGVKYQTHVQTYGWQNYVSNGAESGTTGQAKRLEAIRIKLNNADYSGGIQYRTHVQSYGWMNWARDGAMSGTSGQAKRLEAIQIKLTGEMANKYDVYYRVHSQKFGWLGWAKNGASAGTAGYGYRLESIQIKLVKKGSAAPGSTKNTFRETLVKYRTHVQDYGWQGYVSDGALSGTSGQAKRLEAIQISLVNPRYSGSIQYRTHVQDYGWQGYVSNGALSGTSGQAKRLEAIQIKLTGKMADKYDVYYRVHAQTYGWLGWAKNGASAGSSGYGKRLEAIEIKLVAKGSAAPGSTANTYIEKPTTVAATGITLNKTSYTLTKGGTYTLSATVAPSNATNKTVTWTTSDKSVATVSSTGKVTAVKAGTATITAKTSNGKTATCKITVKDSVQPVTGTDTDQGNQKALYNALFDINNKVTFDMNISDDQIKLMQKDYKEGKDIYRKIDKLTVTVGNKKYDIYEVGVRIKGNTSRVNIYNNGNVDDRNLIHLKISFKETFDDETEYAGNAKVWANDADRKARKKRTFATLKAIELKWNRNIDGTYIGNYYANQLFRASGVVAQNTSLANVRFGGYNYGVYTMYEMVDEVFLKRYFGDDSGDLYKCAWGQTSNGVGEWSGATYKKDTINSMSVEKSGKNFIYELKTNKKKSKHASLKNFINTFAQGTPTKATFESLVDSDRFVKFAAASYFVGNPDDLRNNYNNHYIYFMKNGKAVYIPYDNDRCLGMTVSGKDMTTFSPYADNAALKGSQENPVFRYSIITRNNLYTTEYTNALKAIAESGWLDYSKYKKIYNIAKANYASVAIPDSNVRAYVKEVDAPAKTYKNSDLAFNENNGFNTSVKTYMTKIMKTYNDAIAKWN